MAKPRHGIPDAHLKFVRSLEQFSNTPIASAEPTANGHLCLRLQCGGRVFVPANPAERESLNRLSKLVRRVATEARAA